MTIKVTITNDEVVVPDGTDRYTAIIAKTILVTTIQYERGKHGSRVMRQHHLQPGQSAAFDIHLLTDLHVEELATWISR